MKTNHLLTLQKVPTTHTFALFWKVTWRSMSVASGFMTGLMLAAIISVLLGEGFSVETDAGSSSILVFAASAPVCLSAFFGAHLCRAWNFRVDNISSFGEA
jgi:hypothetical protein